MQWNCVRVYGRIMTLNEFAIREFRERNMVEGVRDIR